MRRVRRRGLFVLPKEPLAGASAILFFGLAVVVALFQLRPESSYLELTSDGFTTCTLFRDLAALLNDVRARQTRSR